jgi:hypothetical protein
MVICIVFIAALIANISCRSTNSAKSAKKGLLGDSKSMSGIVLFSRTHEDLFFPCEESDLITRLNYKTLKYDSGFLVGRISPSRRAKLIMSDADKLSDKRNLPFTHILPVRITFYEINDTVNTNYSTACFVFKDSISCLTVNDRLRFLHSIDPYH